METLYPRLTIDTGVAARPHLDDLFPGSSRLHLEIGFGGGEHLLAEAERLPDVGFIGVEPFLAGMAKAVTGIDERGCTNIRLFAGDATILIDWLPESSISRVDLLYPDPWPKRRHWKRRLVNSGTLDRLARVLIPGGSFRFVSDLQSYVAWTLALVARHPEFTWTAECADDWRRPFAHWAGTRYEAKAVAAGRTPTYLAFARR